MERRPTVYVYATSEGRDSAHKQNGGHAYTYLTPLRPAATIFWKMSSQSSRTGRRKVWNSPELIVYSQCGRDIETRLQALTAGRLVGRGSIEYSCPTGRRQNSQWICDPGVGRLPLRA